MAQKTQQILRNTPTNLIANPFTKSGYSFLGWSTDPSATTAIYEDGGSYSFANDMTLYAVWSEAAAYDLRIARMPAYAGTATGSGTHCAGDTFTIAATATDPRYVFNVWSSDDASLVADKYSAQTTFTMPPANYDITANFVQVFTPVGGFSSGPLVTRTLSGYTTHEGLMDSLYDPNSQNYYVPYDRSDNSVINGGNATKFIAYVYPKHDMKLKFVSKYINDYNMQPFGQNKTYADYMGSWLDDNHACRGLTLTTSTTYLAASSVPTLTEYEIFVNGTKVMDKIVDMQMQYADPVTLTKDTLNTIEFRLVKQIFGNESGGIASVQDYYNSARPAPYMPWSGISATVGWNILTVVGEDTSTLQKDSGSGTHSSQGTEISVVS